MVAYGGHHAESCAWQDETRDPNPDERTIDNERDPGGPRQRRRISSLRAIAEGTARSLADTQRAHILEVLRATDWVIDGDHGAACRLGMQPSTLRGRLKKLGIRRDLDGAR